MFSDFLVRFFIRAFYELFYLYILYEILEKNRSLKFDRKILKHRMYRIYAKSVYSICVFVVYQFTSSSSLY